MKNSLSYRTAFGIVVTAFLATGAATFYVALSQRPRVSATLFTDHLPGLTVEKAPVPEVGLVVTSLQSAGPAEQAGLAVGDDVLAVDQRPVGSLGDLRAVLENHPARTIQLLVLHNDVPIDVSLTRNEDHLHGA
jgi:S1-C subfamily serine protease